MFCFISFSRDILNFFKVIKNAYHPQQCSKDQCGHNERNMPRNTARLHITVCTIFLTFRSLLDVLQASTQKYKQNHSQLILHSHYFTHKHSIFHITISPFHTNISHFTLTISYKDVMHNFASTYLTLFNHELSTHK